MARVPAEIFDASSNLLTGTIPSKYGALIDVNLLNLEDNLVIIGTIPSELGELRNLELVSPGHISRWGRANGTL